MCSGVSVDDGGGQDWFQTRSDEELLAYQQPVAPTPLDANGNPALDENGNPVAPPMEDLQEYNYHLENYNGAQAEIQRRADLKAIAQEREQLMAQQVADSQRMQQEMANQAAAQQEKVNTLRIEQDKKLAGINAAGTAVTQSLRILGQSSGKQAPTAAMASKPKAARGARTSTASLRMGSTSQGTGSGANLSV
jgi:hypothetical protein